MDKGRGGGGELRKIWKIGRGEERKEIERKLRRG